MSLGICGTIHLPILALPPMYEIIIIYVLSLKNIDKKIQKKK
jgi:hypothetical protein